MTNLDELHIALTQESNSYGGSLDYTHIGFRTFPAHFINHWLAPISSNLRALSIYSLEDNWGPFPGFFNFSTVSFPRLESLALGYYTLAHNDSIDWISSIKTLRKLMLHNAMIATWIRIEPGNDTEWDPPMHDWIPTMLGHSEDNWPQWEYPGRWSMFLDRIADELPDLKDFRFDEGSSYPLCPEKEGLYNVNTQDQCGCRVFPKRYVVFDNGTLPTHWPEADDKGELWCWNEETGWPKGVRKEYLEEDQKSLDRLLKRLEERRGVGA